MKLAKDLHVCTDRIFCEDGWGWGLGLGWGRVCLFCVKVIHKGNLPGRLRSHLRLFKLPEAYLTGFAKPSQLHIHRNPECARLSTLYPHGRS